jgi:hypothetical protein
VSKTFPDNISSTSRQVSDRGGKLLERRTHCNRFGGRSCSVTHTQATKVDVNQRGQTYLLTSRGKQKRFFSVFDVFFFWGYEDRTNFIIIL